MSVNGGIACGTSEILAFSVGDMFALLLNVSFGKSEVQQEYFVGSFIEPNTEVIRLDVPMKEVPAVYVFNALNHLINKHQHTLQGELAKSLVEECLKRWPHQIHDQDVIIALSRTVVDVRYALVNNSRIVMQIVVQLALIDKLRVI